MKYLKYTTVIFMTILFIGCGIDNKYLDSGNRKIKSIDTTIKNAELNLKSLKTLNLYKKFRIAAEKENLFENLEKITNLNIPNLKKIKISMSGVIKTDKSKEEKKLIELISQSSFYMNNYTKSYNKILQRLKQYDSFTKEKDSLIIKYGKKLDIVIRNKETLLSKILKMKEEYPSRSKDIDNRTNSTIEKTNILIKIGNTIKSEKDMVLFLEFTDYIDTNEKSINLELNTKTKEINELSISKTRILKDSKLDTFVIGKIFSWDDYSDWDTESTRQLSPIKVDNAFADMIDSNPNIGMIATYPAFMGGYNCKTTTTICSKFSSIMNNKQFASRGDTNGELWLENVVYRPYFKYIDIINGVQKETSWKEVTLADYNKYINYKGYEISSKPYGMFSNEVNIVPAPIGMSMVGNKEYGKWKKDSSGNSFWEFYGKYMFMSNMINMFSGRSNYRYYQSDYNSYRNSNSYSNRRSFNSRSNVYRYSTSKRYSSRSISSPRGRTSSGRTAIGNSSSTARGVSSRGRGASGGGK